MEDREFQEVSKEVVDIACLKGQYTTTYHLHDQYSKLLLVLLRIDIILIPVKKSDRYTT